MTQRFATVAFALACVFAIGSAPLAAQEKKLLAFPGADGAAAYATGGRGGIVYHVTTLDESMADKREGTLRYGLDDHNFADKKPRTIVFDVGGRIYLGRAPQAGWDPNGNGWDTQSRLTISSNITIAGETAPDPGIIIMGGTIKPTGDNIIIRHLTVAPGYGNKGFYEPSKSPPTPDKRPDKISYDAFDISGTNVIIDHCTTVYATDETISCDERANNLSIQWCIIAQGQNYPQADAEAKGVHYTGHALGSLFQPGSGAKLSAHHNLYAHLKGRLPRVGSEKGTGAYNDFRDNVFYNWLGTAGTGARGQPSFNNFINNVYISGNGGEDATGGASPAIVPNRAGGTQIFDGYRPADTRVFADGNLKKIGGGAATPATAGDGDRFDYRHVAVQKTPFAQVPYVDAPDPAAKALDRVLESAGARPWARSAMDKRIIDETRTGRGRIVAWADNPFNNDPREGVEWRSLVSIKPTSRPSNFDSDGDGMPDAWEVAHKLDPKTPDNNGDADGDEYTNLENYLHEFTGETIRR